MKKIIVIALIVLLVISAIFSFFHFFKPRNIYVNETLKAVPHNSSIIIEINSFEDFFAKTLQNSIYAQLISFDGINEDNSLIHFLYKTGKENEEIMSLFNHSSVLLTFQIVGKDKLEQLIIAPLRINETEKTQTQILTKFLESKGEIKTRNYDNAVIYDFKGNIYPEISFSLHKGSIILSRSSLLVESSIRQIESQRYSLSSIKDFDNVYQTAGKNELANIYVNKKQFSEILKLFIQSSFHSGISSMEYFGTWTELDLNVSEDLISLNGFSVLPDSIQSFLNVLASQGASNLNCLKVLPEGTALYLAISINNMVRYDQLLESYLNQTNKQNTRDNKISEIKKQTGIDLKEVFFPMINNEVCFAVTNVNNLDVFQNSFVLVGVKSKSQAENEINGMLKLASKQLNTAFEDYIETLKIDELSSVKIYKLPFTNAVELLFGPLFKNCNAEYVTFVDNFLIFANSKESLFRLVHDAMLNRTLETSIRHNKFLDHFSSRSNLFLYYSSHSGAGLLSHFLNDKTLTSINKNPDVFINLGAFAFQITKSQNMMYNNIVFEHIEEVSDRPQTVWESRLETSIDMKPVIVTNHNNNSKEIIVQDKNNNLYLLSNSGRELWKIHLNENITSQIFQIDYFKNGRLQYLFATESEIHLIDRLGNYVERYPIKLREKASSPMAVFDYENNRNYRIFIACNDNMVYLYDIEGNIVKGWDFEGSENTVNSEISFYRYKNEDFIVFNDIYKAYILSRRGEEKIRVKSGFEFSKNNNIYIDNLSNQLNFIATDTKGGIKIIDGKGEIETVNIREYSPDHYFSIADINRNGSNDYIFLDHNVLEVYNKNKTLLFKYEFESNPDIMPVFYNFPRNQIKIGIVCKSIGSIYLLNHDGTLYNGFPLQGLTQFSIGYLSSTSNKFNLIVGGPENLLFNYEVNEN